MLKCLRHPYLVVYLLGLEVEKEETKYKYYLQKRIELINWVVEKMNNADIPLCEILCEVIETRMNEIINKINQTDSIFEADPLDTELRILDSILYSL